MPDKPEIKVPLEDWVVQIAEKTAHCVFEQYRSQCPCDDHTRRLNKLEIRFTALVAFMAGSGVLGGLTGALFSKMVAG